MNMLLVPFADRDHQVELGTARKMVDIRLPFDPSWFKVCIIFWSRPTIAMCGPTWNSAPVPIACDPLGTHLPSYMYEIQMRCRV
jgi:hypothetical protein